jgi:hypothetical protein
MNPSICNADFITEEMKMKRIILLAALLISLPAFAGEKATSRKPASDGCTPKAAAAARQAINDDVPASCGLVPASCGDSCCLYEYGKDSGCKGFNGQLMSGNGHECVLTSVSGKLTVYDADENEHFGGRCGTWSRSPQ